jgi:hypothetical protein
MEQNEPVQFGWVGGWIFRFWLHLALLFICTAFMAMLFAPMFSEMFEKPMIRKYCVYPNYEELVKRDMTPIKRTLWALCVVAWMVIIALNVY